VRYDVIVLGVGGMGSAAAAHLARRGQNVLAIEQFELGHALGSSHGESRIIRLAYFEHPSYVPLLRRAFELWRALEAACGVSLLQVTGALDVGFEGDRVFEGSLRACREHVLPHSVLTGDALQTQFPAWRAGSQVRAVFQPDGGLLRPEQCILAHVAQAREWGAVMLPNTTVRAWQTTASGVRVTTSAGVFDAGQLVITAGAWIPELVPSLAPLVVPERQVVGWFDIDAAQRATFAPAAFPVFVLENSAGFFYGFPEQQSPGFKIGKYHHRSEVVTPGTLDRTVTAADEAALREAVQAHFPGADGAMHRASVCMFSNTPDEHFLIDRVDGAPQVLVVSACSGHGFKFASVVGEIVADLVIAGTTSHDISRFRSTPARWTPAHS
jgi:sarcosine oxidase